MKITKSQLKDIIREELDYKFSRLEKKLNEVIVTGNNVNLVKAKRQAIQDTSLKKTVNSPVDSSVPTPKTNNSVLNKLLKETAQSDDWKTVEGKGEAEVQSVQDNPQELPEHLANAFTKDYSEVMKKVDEKAKFKNGT
jgi:hypothetical protein